MGSLIRLTSLVLCVAGGIGAAIWLAGDGGLATTPARVSTDAPSWQGKSPEARPSDIKPPVVLVSKEQSESFGGQPPLTSVTDLLALPKPGDEASLSKGPWLLPPAGVVGQNIPDDMFEQQPAAGVSPDLLAPQSTENGKGNAVEQVQSGKAKPSPAAAEAALPAPAAKLPAGGTPEAVKSSTLEPPLPPNAIPSTTAGVTPLPPAPGSASDKAAVAKEGPRNGLDKNIHITPEGDGRLSLHLVDSDIREVLQLLSRGAGVAIMPSDAVQGKLSASLPNVDFQTALNAIVKTKGLAWRREGNVIYVGTQEEFKKRDVTSGRITTRLYRPNYVRAAELQKLFTPLLTPQVGIITVTSPSGVGIGADSATAGGDDYANSDVVLVRDYDNVLAQIDRVFREVDIQPLQVEIEAMILSVKLADSMDLGVDFEALRDNDHVRVVSGTPIQTLAGLTAGKGLKVGFLDSNLSVFLKALETVGDTNVIATPRILALNKMRAEILIGAQLGYVSTTVTETSTTQAVQFLEVGTQLRIRPFISNDGMVRMELHPELSTGNVRVQEGLTLPDKEVTGVTTNIMARDGSTVIIGGLIREDLDKQETQIPLFGSLPIVGPVFRQKVEKIDRREIIVLITPRIVCDPELNREGNHAATEFHHRQAVVGEKMSPFSNTHLCKKYIFLAQQAWAAGNQARAMRLINLALHFDPENRSALDLRADIVGGVQFGDHTRQGPFLPGVENRALDNEEIPSWILDGLDPAAPPAHPLPRPKGIPGEQVDITSPGTP